MRTPPLGRDDLAALLDRFAALRVLVVGDYFLDRYLVMDRALSEVSLETGLEARQVVARRSSPGAAGTIVNNLRALGVGAVCIGVLGDDGEGYELLAGLEAVGADTHLMVRHPALMTPTYIKPMMCEADGSEHELERMDIKNREPLPVEVEGQIITALHTALPTVDGVIISEFIYEPDCGTLTTQVRMALNALAAAHPSRVFTVDSRPRIGAYRGMILKPNIREAQAAVGMGDAPDSPAGAEEAGRVLARQTGQPVFITAGAQGMLVCEAERCIQVPTVQPDGPIDTVGAGDSAMAGLTAALCAGASPQQAALVGNLVASVTIRQIGTTGTATPAQVMEQYDRLADQQGW
ncbi:MAG: D-glycero-beta-D-manno-heptose-7-phosphate kinase [Anaerolineae bacterium]